MEYLLIQPNLKVLESFSMVKSLVAFDYDGTLAPIVTNPSLATMRESTEDLFRKLCSARPVAIISGRSINDMYKLLKVKPKYLIGNHGVEWEDSDLRSSKMNDYFSKIKKSILESLDQNKKFGILFEDKGYSLSLHYRNSPDLKGAESFLNELTSSLSFQARIIPGKFVFNVVALDSVDKYSALIQAMGKEKCKFGIYFGDDDTDEDVFKNINSNILTVRIGRDDKSQAKYYLKDQNEMDQVISYLTNEKTK